MLGFEGLEVWRRAVELRAHIYRESGEVRTQTIVGIEAKFIPEPIGNNACEETKQLAAMINGPIRSIRRQSLGCQLPTANCQLPTAN